MAIGAVWAAVLIMLATLCMGEIRVSIIPIEMTVKDVSYKAAKEIDPSHMGFFLIVREACNNVLHGLQCIDIHCILNSKLIKPIFTFNNLQNIATVMLDETGRYAKDWLAWKQMLLLVDVICYCAVLFSIVWSIKNLCEATNSEKRSRMPLLGWKILDRWTLLLNSCPLAMILDPILAVEANNSGDRREKLLHKKFEVKF